MCFPKSPNQGGKRTWQASAKSQAPLTFVARTKRKNIVVSACEVLCVCVCEMCVHVGMAVVSADAASRLILATNFGYIC